MAALKLPGDRVDRNLNIMTTLKYLSASGGLPISPWGKPEPPTTPTYVLTNDLGLSWANGGFRPIGTVPTPVVHISITINHFLEQVAQLPIDDDVKEDIRQTAEQLQEDPSWALFQQLMSFGANSLVVLPTVLNFLLENAKAINNFVEFHPLGV